MTALLELKQKIKGIYGQYEMYILPVLKFVLALVYFLWVNSNMGYMSQLNNVFVILILALICSILPSSAMMYIGFILILAHSYALGIEVAGFMLVIILLMLIFFMRFSGEQNITFVFTPLSFAFSIPALLPIGSGLMESSLSAIPAGCGVVMYYFIRFLRVQSAILSNPDLDMTDKLQIMADGLVQNWGMWIAVVAFVAVTLLVNLIRTRSFDHAWRISIYYRRCGICVYNAGWKFWNEPECNRCNGTAACVYGFSSASCTGAGILRIWRGLQQS